MTLREPVLKAYAKGLNQSEVARILGCSRQQVWRIVNQAGVNKSYTVSERSIPHGTDAGYRGRGCRCKACCKANTTVLREFRARQRERIKANPRLAPHGEINTYSNWGCKCKKCRAAWSEYTYAYRESKK